MDEPIRNISLNTTYGTLRRSLFGRIAGATALGLAGLLLPASSGAQESATAADGPLWPGKLKGRHRQVLDAYEVNKGAPLAFAYTFLAPNASPGAATAVIVLRHGALPLALNHAMWEKYQIGEALKVTDPETKAPATKNPFLNPKPGVLPLDDMAIDRLLGSGALFGACNVAIRVLSSKLASNAGVSAEDAAKEWTVNIVPGITIIPSGTWGVNRAQEAGCTYCSGGG
jgi:hypothetical protein